MLLKKIGYASEDYFSKIKSRNIIFFYTLVALFIRLPFFFRDYIDRDESTFIIMGQSWVDGHLPYTELWDLKPPFVFLFFAAIIYVFGKSFIAIRLIGSLVIALTSFILYKIGVKIHSKKAGFIIGLLYIYTSSLFGNVQGVMSEHLSMFLFLLGFLFLLKKQIKINVFFAGIIFGAALLTKLNLSYAYLLILAAYFVQLLKVKPRKTAIIAVIILNLGALLSLVLSFLPYYINDLQKLYVDSVFLAPLAYSDTPLNQRISVLLPIAVLLVLCLFFIRRQKRFSLLKPQHLFLIYAAILGVVYSFFKLGKLNSHYLIQLYPFLLLLLLPFLLSFPKIKSKAFGYTLVVLFLLAPIESYLEYSLLGKRIATNESVYYREGIQIPNYLKDKLNEKDKVLFLDFHIGYWLLDKKPPTKAVTHPTNINRVNLYPFYNTERTSSLEELVFILEKIKPTIIVTKNGSFPSFDLEDPINAYFKSYLAKFYFKEKTIGKGQIYRIKSEDSKR